jgi:hypothetical protein
MTQDVIQTTPNHDVKHWTPPVQRAFLESLAQTGSVQQACAQVQLTPSTVYRVRTAARGAALQLGWQAAILIARDRLVDDLMGRAVDGQTDTIIHDGQKTTRYRHENRVALSMLARLDKRADEALCNSGDAIIARVIAQDFNAYLDLIESGGTLAQAGLFIALRQPQIPQNSEAQEQCDLLAEQEAEEARMAERIAEINDPEMRAANLSVWDDDGDLRTNFPPPPDFDGDEEGEFGGDDYSRSLTAEEESVYWTREEARLAPFRAAAITSRDAYFGFAAAKRVAARKARAKAQKPAKKPAAKAKSVSEPVPVGSQKLREAMRQYGEVKSEALQVFSPKGIPLAPWEVDAQKRMAALAEEERAAGEAGNLNDDHKPAEQESPPPVALKAPVWPDYIVDPGTGFRQFSLPVHTEPFAGGPVPPEFRGLGW